jgi:nitrogenase molybdenum-iron protein alpha chain
MGEIVDLAAKINLSTSSCPNREQRANGVNVFYGKASEIVAAARAGDLKHQERAFQQTSGCILNFYLTVRVSTIRDAVMIVHAPVGCSSSALGYRELFKGIPKGTQGLPDDFEFHWLTTNLNERDVVYGASEKLKAAIHLAEERYNPKAIFIMTSCTSGIIGEDIDGVVSEVQPTISATLVPVHCEGTKSRLVQTGYDVFWHAVLKYLVKPPKKKQPDLVNIASMLSYTWQDRIEITRLLNKVGLRVNFIPEFATVEQFERLSEAAVTAPICPSYTEYLSRGLEQEYGVPYFLYPSPVGVAHTDEWLRTIAKYTGKEKEVEALIAEEHAQWIPQLKNIQEEFRRLGPDGDKLDVLGSLGQGRLLTQTPFFNELGVKSTAAIVQDFDNLVLDEMDKVLAETGDFDVLVNTFQAAEVAHVSHTRAPDIVLSCPFQGSAYKRDKGMTRIHALRGDAREWSTQAGYKGAVAAGNFLLQSTRNKSFQQTMKANTEETYTDWWFEQPKPYYLKEEAA